MTAHTRLSTVGAAALVWFLVSQTCSAAELIMFRRSGCSYCRTWDREVGPIYPKSDLGRQAPIRMVDLDKDDQPKVHLHRSVYYTPTFVLVHDGREVGRVEGYPGEEFFWALLDRLLRTLPGP